LVNDASREVFDHPQVISRYLGNYAPDMELNFKSLSIFVFGQTSFIANLISADSPARGYVLIAN